jgi:hypothetical protein
LCKTAVFPATKGYWDNFKKARTCVKCGGADEPASPAGDVVVEAPVTLDVSAVLSELAELKGQVADLRRELSGCVRTLLQAVDNKKNWDDSKFPD